MTVPKSEWGASAIRWGLEQGLLYCNPAPEDHRIHAIGIDVHLGEHFWVPKHIYAGYNYGPRNLRDFDPEEYFEYCHADDFDGCVAIPPNGFTLGHTIEFIGSTVHWIKPDLDTRSTIARCGVMTHLTAGRGDPGFHSRWVVEIKTGHDDWDYIPVGSRISCVQFTTVEGNFPEDTYVGRYNTPEHEWSPKSMLPRKGNL